MELTDLQLDALKETTSIGAGNAATALSKLAKRTITMTVPSASLLTLRDLRALIPRDTRGTVLSRLSILGDAPGTLVISFDHGSAVRLCRVLLEPQGVSPAGSSMGEMEVSALQEAVNIIGGAYLTALSGFLGLSMRTSVPFLAIDDGGSVIDGIFEELGSLSDQALVIRSTLHERNHSLQVTLFVKPQPEALVRILKALRMDQA